MGRQRPRRSGHRGRHRPTSPDVEPRALRRRAVRAGIVDTSARRTAREREREPRRNGAGLAPMTTSLRGSRVSALHSSSSLPLEHTPAGPLRRPRSYRSTTSGVRYTRVTSSARRDAEHHGSSPFRRRPRSFRGVAHHRFGNTLAVDDVQTGVVVDLRSSAARPRPSATTGRMHRSRDAAAHPRTLSDGAAESGDDRARVFHRSVAVVRRVLTFGSRCRWSPTCSSRRASSDHADEHHVLPIVAVRACFSCQSAVGPIVVNAASSVSAGPTGIA